MGYSDANVSGAARYDPTRIGKLEANLSEQVRSGSYDLDVNLALLRHYNFAPEKANIQAIATMLIKAQMRLPSHDFGHMLLLIPERLQEEQPIAALIALTQHLEGGRFLAYWQAADSCKDILGSVPGYYEAIRAYITGAISITCQKVSKTLLGEILHLEGANLDQLIQENKSWSESQGEGGRVIVRFPKIEQHANRAQGSAQGGLRVDMTQLGLLLQTTVH